MAGCDLGVYGDAEYFAEPALVADPRRARLTAGELAEPKRADGNAARSGEPAAARLCLARPTACVSQDRHRGDGDAVRAQLDRGARRSP